MKNVPAHAPLKREMDKKAIETCLYLWLKDNGVDVSKLEGEAIRKRAETFMAETGMPMPILGKLRLRDGKTGEFYDNPLPWCDDDAQAASPCGR